MRILYLSPGFPPNSHLFCVAANARGANVLAVGDLPEHDLPPEARQAVLGRGRRLDESKPGSGLGLSIVADLATLYRGRFTLEQAALGGLRAVLEVPGDAPVGAATH